ncbi:bacterial alpha-L-rhamnosidase-domain-containing protein [Roridomyces roridus]|uniref:alpha-L-rhamnosidase n=1 Tax=Roridomyces roridus TaxID=1738132 RepID=A0AAD7B4Y8_9AGAR|nr:bacterial alpha-L-rhamnosidase-domain-containing protein [Roridomyces roridus]
MKPNWLGAAASAFLVLGVSAQVTLNTLLVENKPAPLGIDVSPRFSWLIDSSARGVAQESYQLKVSKVSAGASDVWDSGVVSSPNPYLAPYGGPALTADTTYFWSINVVTTAGSASASSNFTTGLLTSGDWGSSSWIGKNVSIVPASLLTAFTSAQWIWATESGQTVPNAPPGQVALRFTYTPPAGKTPASATVLATADDQFTLYANGALVGSSPNTTDVWKQAQIFNDVSLSGSSTTLFAILATNAADVGTGGPGPAGVLFSALIAFTDGSTALVSSSSSWKGINAPIPANFQSPSTSDSSWAGVQTLGAYGVDPWDTSVVVAAPTPTTPTFTTATWVWNTAVASPVAGNVAFRKTISPASATATPVSAAIVMTVDDFFTLYLNGAQIGSSPNASSEWQVGQQFDDVKLDGAGGKNVFAVLATNNPDATSGGPSPAGLLFSANVLYSDGTTQAVVSDGSWKATADIPNDFADPGLDDSSWGAAQTEGTYGVQPWATNVGIADPLGEHPAPLLRKSFTLTKQVTSARLYYAAGGYAHITLNGLPVSDHVLSPGFTKYDTRMQYVSLDVMHLLSIPTPAATSSLENVLGAELGRSHYGVTQGSVWNWNSAPWHGEPVLRLVLSLEFTDGSTQRVVSDGTWKNIEGPTRLDDVFGGENYNASYEIPNWNDQGFDDSAWNTALVATAPKGVLVSARNPPTRVVASLTPVSITQPVQGQYVAAFERVVAGWVRLTAQGPKDTLITVHYGEKLNPDGTVIWQDEQHYYENNWQTDRFWLAGTGAPETFEPKFSYKGYQYITIFGWPGSSPPTPADIIGQVAHDDLDKYGDFTSSSDLLNKLHVAAVFTLLNNLHSIPTDCPTFEKNGWTGDAQLSAESFLSNLDATDLLGKYAQDTTDSLAAGSGPPAVIIPDSGWGANNQADPWHAALILIPAFVYQYRGDTRILSDNYDGMKAYIEFELGRSPNNIATTGLGDWDTPETSPLGGNPPEDPRVPATAYLYHMFDTMATVATVLGKTSDASSFASQAVAIKNAFNAAFLNPSLGYYTGVGDSGYRQSHNLLSLAFNLTPNATTAQVVADSVVADVQARGTHLNTGALSSKQLLPMLTQHGHADTALALAEQTTYPSWGYWIENGATTMWEHWLLTARSHDHHFLGTFEDWFYKNVLGIQATSTAFHNVNIAPAYTSSNLTSASGWMRTPFGNLTVSWANNGGDAGFSLNVGVPVGVNATVSFAVGAQVQEAGKPVAQAAGISILPAVAGGPVRVAVGSGTYSFVAK